MPYSTYLYIDFHLCSMTKLKEHSREICYGKSQVMADLFVSVKSWMLSDIVLRQSLYMVIGNP